MFQLLEKDFINCDTFPEKESSQVTYTNMELFTAVKLCVNVSTSCWIYH